MIGGAESHFQALGNLLQNRGHETAFYYPAEIEGWRNKTARLQQIIVEFKPQIVHLHSLDHKHLQLFKLFSAHNIPMIQTLHDHRMICLSGSLFSKHLCRLCRGGKYYRSALQGCVNWQLGWSTYLSRTVLKENPYARVKLFLTPSNYLKNELRDWGVTSRLEHLENFIRLSDYREIINPESKDLIFSGRLSPLKGIDTLLDAVKGLPYHVKILGDGVLKPRLDELIKTGDYQNISLVGFKTGEAYRQELADSALMIVPSPCPENSPQVIAEAMALGLPVLGSNLGGIPELLDDGKGMVFEPGDSADLRGKIITLMENRELRLKMSGSCRTFAGNNFSEEKYYTKLLSYYQALVQK